MCRRNIRRSFSTSGISWPRYYQCPSAADITRKVVVLSGNSYNRYETIAHHLDRFRHKSGHNALKRISATSGAISVFTIHPVAIAGPMIRSTEYEAAKKGHPTPELSLAFSHRPPPLHPPFLSGAPAPSIFICPSPRTRDAILVKHRTNPHSWMSITWNLPENARCSAARGRAPERIPIQLAPFLSSLACSILWVNRLSRTVFSQQFSSFPFPLPCCGAAWFHPAFYHKLRLVTAWGLAACYLPLISACRWVIQAIRKEKFSVLHCYWCLRGSAIISVVNFTHKRLLVRLWVFLLSPLQSLPSLYRAISSLRHNLVIWMENWNLLSYSVHTSYGKELPQGERFRLRMALGVWSLELRLDKSW